MSHWLAPLPRSEALVVRFERVLAGSARLGQLSPLAHAGFPKAGSDLSPPPPAVQKDSGMIPLDSTFLLPVLATIAKDISFTLSQVDSRRRLLRHLNHECHISPRSAVDDRRLFGAGNLLFSSPRVPILPPLPSNSGRLNSRIFQPLPPRHNLHVKTRLFCPTLYPHICKSYSCSPSTHTLFPAKCHALSTRQHLDQCTSRPLQWRPTPQHHRLLAWVRTMVTGF